MAGIIQSTHLLLFSRDMQAVELTLLYGHHIFQWGKNDILNERMNGFLAGW